MAEPTMPLELAGWDARAERHKQEAILDELRASHRLPPHVWSRMQTTLAELRAGPVPWLATRYLQAVATRGPAMFDNPVQQTLEATAPLLACPCGGRAPVDDVVRRGTAMVTSGTCPDCRLVVAEHTDNGN